MFDYIDRFGALYHVKLAITKLGAAAKVAAGALVVKWGPTHAPLPKRHCENKGRFTTLRTCYAFHFVKQTR